MCKLVQRNYSSMGDPHDSLLWLQGGQLNQLTVLCIASRMGGCSSVNWMLYIRGNPKGESADSVANRLDPQLLIWLVDCFYYRRRFHEDYDLWNEEHGCEGWSYENVLPYFRRSENRFQVTA